MTVEKLISELTKVGNPKLEILFDLPDEGTSFPVEEVSAIFLDDDDDTHFVSLSSRKANAILLS